MRKMVEKNSQTILQEKDLKKTVLNNCPDQISEIMTNSSDSTIEGGTNKTWHEI